MNLQLLMLSVILKTLMWKLWKFFEMLISIIQPSSKFKIWKFLDFYFIITMKIEDSKYRLTKMHDKLGKIFLELQKHESHNLLSCVKSSHQEAAKNHHAHVEKQYSRWFKSERANEKVSLLLSQCHVVFCRFFVYFKRWKQAEDGKGEWKVFKLLLKSNWERKTTTTNTEWH